MRTARTSGQGQMPPMVRVGRAHWRSHGATGEAGNGRPPLIKNSMPSARACSINRGSFTHRKTRHRPAHQPPHLPQGPRGAPCLFSWGTLRACPLSAAPVCSGGRGRWVGIAPALWHSCTRDFHLGPKRGIAQVPQNCSHPDLRGLVGTLFGFTLVKIGAGSPF